jgi:orotate phosphoribosyltransferase-like protein
VRERIAEARRLRAEGIGLREIAQQLNVRTSKRSTALETVQRWIGKE